MSLCLDNRALLAQLATPDALVEAYVKAMASVHDGQSHFLQTISEILVDVEDDNTFQSKDLNPRAIVIVGQMRIIAILAHREVDQEACRRRRRRHRAPARGERRGGGGGHRRSKKIWGKKEGGGNRLLRRMGKAPFLLLPLDDRTTTNADDCASPQAQVGWPWWCPLRSSRPIVTRATCRRRLRRVSCRPPGIGGTAAVTTGLCLRRPPSPSSWSCSGADDSPRPYSPWCSTTAMKMITHGSNAAFVYVSCPRGMKRDYLYAKDGGGGGGLLAEIGVHQYTIFFCRGKCQRQLDVIWQQRQWSSRHCSGQLRRDGLGG
jgi:hypothetical protein